MGVLAGVALLMAAGVVAAEEPPPPCLPEAIRAACPGFLAIEPDTSAACVWWFDVRRTLLDRRRYNFPTRVRCEEARKVAVEVIGPEGQVDVECH